MRIALGNITQTLIKGMTSAPEDLAVTTKVSFKVLSTL
jgi:hypothetical protein